MPGHARQQASAAAEPGVMTVGELSRRTGMKRKAIRELADRGLISNRSAYGRPCSIGHVRS
jgi:hypothetical protein